MILARLIDPYSPRSGPPAAPERVWPRIATAVGSTVQKLAIYPSGLQGAALLALRAAVILPLAQDALRPGVSHSLACTALLLFPIAAGSFTRLAAVGCVAWAAAMFIEGHVEGLELLTRLLIAITLAGLGPGAYSMDARLFGRRVIRVSAPSKE